MRSDKHIYTVYGSEERRFVIDVEAENEEEAMRLVDGGCAEDWASPIEYLTRESINAESAELSD
jgi:hypothetical protein